MITIKCSWKKLVWSALAQQHKTIQGGIGHLKCPMSVTYVQFLHCSHPTTAFTVKFLEYGHSMVDQTFKSNY